MLRIVAGEWRGRRIQAPRGRATRPTAEKVRGAIFNVLAARIELEGATVWDLFAGSGAMGIEALSRGARHATFVESDPRAAAGIAGNLTRLGAPRERWTVADLPFQSWASALLAKPELGLRPVTLEPASVLDRFGSYLATGEISTADDESMLVASVHTRAAEAPDWPWSWSITTICSGGQPSTPMPSSR